MKNEDNFNNEFKKREETPLIWNFGQQRKNSFTFDNYDIFYGDNSMHFYNNENSFNNNFRDSNESIKISNNDSASNLFNFNNNINNNSNANNFQSNSNANNNEIISNNNENLLKQFSLLESIFNNIFTLSNNKIFNESSKFKKLNFLDIKDTTKLTKFKEINTKIENERTNLTNDLNSLKFAYNNTKDAKTISLTLKKQINVIMKLIDVTKMKINLITQIEKVN